jgi:hypothetical protein
MAMGTEESPRFFDRDYLYLSVSRDGKFFLCCRGVCWILYWDCWFTEFCSTWYWLEVF